MKLKKIWKAFKQTFICFFDENILKYCASLSYYTVFSIGPLLLIIVSLLGFFFGGSEPAQDRILHQFDELLGKSVVMQLDEILNSFNNGDEGVFGIITGSIVLILGSTGIFLDMKDSINLIWHIRTKPGGFWLRLLLNRLLSFSLVVSMGFLLLVSLVVSAFLEALSERLSVIFSNGMVIFFMIINYILILVITSGLFFAIYKVLPDARVHWKDVAAGSIFTAVMFMIGKFLITLYISKSSFTVTYGAAASIIILLAWVYYSAAILYLGAEFTRQYALHAGKGITPKPNSIMVHNQEIAIKVAEAEPLKV
jgi:membrane protein